MRKYFKATAVLGVPNFIKLITGVIKNKVIAIILGAEGLGIVSMSFYAINTLIPLSILGSELSVIKYTAESKTNEEAHRVLLAGIFFVVFNSFVLIISLLIFKQVLSLWIFRDKNYLYAIFWIALAFPFYSLSEIIVHYLKGRKFITQFAIATSIAAILSLCISVPLIYYLGIKGCFLQILTTGLISFVVLAAPIFKEKGIFINIKNVLGFLRLFKSLIKTGFLLYFIPRIFYIFTLFLVKIMIIKNFGFKSNGIYESITFLSVVIFSFLSDTLMGYFLPVICNNIDVDKKNNELNEVIRFIILISVPIIVITGIYIGRFLLKILFSNQFLLAFEFLPFRFIGDYFYLINSALTFIFMAQSNYKVVLMVSIIYNGLILSLSFLLPIYVGFKGYFMAYLLAAFLIFIMISLILKKRHTIRIFKQNYNIILFSALVMIACFFLAQNKYLQFIIIPIIIIWLFANFSVEELRRHWKSIKESSLFKNRLRKNEL